MLTINMLNNYSVIIHPDDKSNMTRIYLETHEKKVFDEVTISKAKYQAIVEENLKYLKSDKEWFLFCLLTQFFNKKC